MPPYGPKAMFLVNREKRLSIYDAGLAEQEEKEETYARVDELRVISSMTSLEVRDNRMSIDTASLLMFKGECRSRASCPPTWHSGADGQSLVRCLVLVTEESIGSIAKSPLTRSHHAHE